MHELGEEELKYQEYSGGTSQLTEAMQSMYSISFRFDLKLLFTYIFLFCTGNIKIKSPDENCNSGFYCSDLATK